MKRERKNNRQNLGNVQTRQDNKWYKNNENKTLYTLPVLHTNCHLKKHTGPKVDPHTGGMWFVHGTKRHKKHQLQSLELEARYLGTIYI